ncbi:lipase [soil metagenome]
MAGPETERPSVLIVGGFATSPPNYWPMRGRLLRRAVERVDIAPIWAPDSAIAALLGFGPMMRRTARAIARTYVAGGRRPIIVVAHSGGGIAARLAMSDVVFHGRRAGVADAVGCLVTLGTPHRLADLDSRYHHAGHEAAAFLGQHSPGAFYAPRTSYLSVGSRRPLTRPAGPLGRAVLEFFELVVGGASTQATGDGIVSTAASQLEGAEGLILDDVLHGHIGSPWYGDDHVIERWWPAAERLWRAALVERGIAAGWGGAGQDRPEALDFAVAGWSSGSSSGS